MADPRAFISFDFDKNSTERILFVGQIKNSRTPFSVEDWSSKEDLPQAEWEELLNAKIGKCHLMIVLVGRSMGSATGVAKEIRFANSQNVPFFGVYVDGAGTSSTLPSGLARSRTIAWDWDKIADSVDQMMGEGKNK
ncbi:MAG: TIR domain-containing protein [Bacteroidetes bacterium]|nr:TIR domain-containing protein [Bacteroidota bacterium]